MGRLASSCVSHLSRSTSPGSCRIFGSRSIQHQLPQVKIKATTNAPGVRKAPQLRLAREMPAHGFLPGTLGPHTARQKRSPRATASVGSLARYFAATASSSFGTRQNGFTISTSGRPGSLGWSL